MGNPIDGISDLPDTEEFFESDQDAPSIIPHKITFDQARHVLSGAQGKVLTIIDATYTDTPRLKFVKDLIRNAFSEQGNWLFELAIREFEPVAKK